MRVFAFLIYKGYERRKIDQSLFKWGEKPKFQVNGIGGSRNQKNL